MHDCVIDTWTKLCCATSSNDEEDKSGDIIPTAVIKLIFYHDAILKACLKISQIAKLCCSFGKP